MIKKLKHSLRYIERKFLKNDQTTNMPKNLTVGKLLYINTSALVIIKQYFCREKQKFNNIFYLSNKIS
jgi:hypothetical protein